jgi:NAD(P)-dependent dehydrogenase (short-subunit alcohol dehydrogenase family)
LDYINYQAPKNLLKERVILVTGAGGGIGRAVAVAFAQAGADLILLGRQEKLLQETAELAGMEQQRTPLVVPMDLRTLAPADYTGLSKTIDKHFGKLDGLLHNAAVLGTMGPIASSDVETWYGVIQVNLNATYLLTRELLPFMERSDSASIVFTSSGVGRVGRAYWGAYSVSKFAGEGLMQVLADELAQTTNIRVNSIDPGAVNTAMRRSAYPAEDPKSNPNPESIVGGYLYLMGADSNDVNGQALRAQ